jgi:peptide/nickel transport system substrate-binding protein
MSTVNMLAPDPQSFMRQWVSWEVAQKSNKWQGQNTTRWQNADYDAAYKKTEVELDPVKRAAMFIAMNDMIVNAPTEIPLIYRPSVHAIATKLVPTLSGWSGALCGVKDWYKEA